VPTAQKMTDVSLSIFRSKFKKTRIQMIDYLALRGLSNVPVTPRHSHRCRSTPADDSGHNGETLVVEVPN
jgi:hypothetical protein